VDILGRFLERYVCVQLPFAMWYQSHVSFTQSFGKLALRFESWVHMVHRPIRLLSGLHSPSPPRFVLISSRGSHVLYMIVGQEHLF
jgi:hypothetical protein